MHRPIFVTGIGTGVGKTVVAALLTEQLQADYWKPVQAGDLEQSDSISVGSLISNSKTVIHPERYRFNLAASPHKAAAFEGISIANRDFVLPETENLLVVEGAGGLMVPLSDSLLMVDLITKFGAEAVLVVRNYLGCINHTLLSMHLLWSRNIPIHSVVFNGDMDPDTESVLLRYFSAGTSIIRVPEFAVLDREALSQCPNIF